MVTTNEKAFSLLPVLFAIIVIAVIAGVAWHMGTTRNQTVQIGGSRGPSFPKGNMSNTYTYSNEIYPNLPSAYKLVNYNSNSFSSALGSAKAADYTTAKTIDQVHSDMESICKAHGFTYSPQSYPTVECISRNATWVFTILPASNLIDQSWYETANSQQPISALSSSVWLQVQSGQIIINGP